MIARAGADRSESGRFPLPRSGGLPAPLFPKTAKEMVEQCKKEIMAIKRNANKTKRIESVGGVRCHTGNDYEPEAVTAIEAWQKRIEEIERAVT